MSEASMSKEDSDHIFNAEEDELLDDDEFILHPSTNEQRMLIMLMNIELRISEMKKILHGMIHHGS